VFFRAITTETVTNVTGQHFFDVFCAKLFFDNKHACCNRGVFSVVHSCRCLTGLGLNILVLFPSLIWVYGATTEQNNRSWPAEKSWSETVSDLF